MFNKIIKRVYVILFGALVLLGLIYPLQGSFATKVPSFEDHYAVGIEKEEYVHDRGDVKRNKTLRENVVELFYPTGDESGNRLFKVIKNLTLGMMIVFFVVAGASLLLGKKSDEMQKSLWSILYIMLGGVFIYGANRLFGSVFNFGGGDVFVNGDSLEGYTKSFIGKNSVLFKILSAIKAFAFFLAIIMIVITGFKVISAGEGEKGKKLVKGIINVVVALLIIKGVDFVYYMAADTQNFTQRASDFIINVAKVFGYIYGVVIVIMVLVAGYLYLTDGGSGSGFKKASNVLVNILLSGLVLFSFLLILYQVFAEFRTGGDAVEGTMSSDSSGDGALPTTD